jgi:hypothetical protein
MAITVYWACLEDEWIKAEEPQKVSQRFYSRNIKNKEKETPISVNHCPVFNEELVNLYAVKSIYDYSFKIENDYCISNKYDQKFFDDHVVRRSIEKRVFSFLIEYVFFIEDDSLEITAGLHPFLEENEVSKRCMIFPGKFDIGKYFRNLEFAFILKKEFDEFIVNDEDVLYYLKFHTKEKIIFKQFKTNENIEKMIKSARLANKHNNKKANIETFYNKFKGKRYILNEIKQNLLD